MKLAKNFWLEIPVKRLKVLQTTIVGEEINARITEWNKGAEYWFSQILYTKMENLINTLMLCSVLLKNSKKIEDRVYFTVLTVWISMLSKTTKQCDSASLISWRKTLMGETALLLI